MKKAAVLHCCRITEVWTREYYYKLVTFINISRLETNACAVYNGVAIVHLWLSAECHRRRNQEEILGSTRDCTASVRKSNPTLGEAGFAKQKTKTLGLPSTFLV